MKTRRREVVLHRASAIALAILFLPAPAVGGDRQLLLEVYVNDRPIGAIGEFVEHDGRLATTAAELEALGLAGAAGRDRGATVELGTLPGLSYRIDEGAQRLMLTAPDQALLPTAIQGRADARALPPAQAGFGAVLNYDVNASRYLSRSFGAGYAEMRAFSPYGTLSVSGLGYAGSSVSRHPAIRLDAGFTMDNPDSFRRTRFGDFINGGLSWTRPVRMGGVQVASNFGLRPDLVTFPVPVISGSAAVSSTVDVLVNGVRQLSAPVGAGPFAIRQLPVVTGAGEIAVNVRDALGRESLQTLPFYATGAMLAPGLIWYAAEAGWVRRNYGLESDEYGDPVATGSIRHGLNEWLTLEAHGEAARGLLMGGAGAVTTIGNIGVASASIAASTGGGLQVSAGFERVSASLSVSASVTQSGSGFQDVAALNGDLVPSSVVRASAGIPFGDAGTLGIAYVGVNRRRGHSSKVGRSSDLFASSFTLLQEDASILSLSYSRPISNRATLTATGYTDLSRTDSHGVMVAVSFVLGPRSSAGIGAFNTSAGTMGTAQATRTAAEPGEYGYQLAVQEGGSQPRRFAEGEYRSAAGKVTAGVDVAGGRGSFRAGAQGAVVFADGSFFLANPIQDSFAIVDAGQPGITVLRENRPVGKTNADGRLLVVGLRAYERNRLAINPADVPSDGIIGETEREIRPRDRAGTVVSFSIARGSSARVRMIDGTGKPLPVGSIVTHVNTGSRGPVGYDGEAFVTGLVNDNRLEVRRPNGTECRVSFDFLPVDGTVPILGPFTCQEPRL